jgi:uncharacterized protein (DUF4415 family)
MPEKLRSRLAISSTVLGRSAAEIPLRHVRQKITMNLDSDIIEFFKARSEEEGAPYQFLINQTLRDHVRGNRVERVAEEVSKLLLSDETFFNNLSELIKSKRVSE